MRAAFITSSAAPWHQPPERPVLECDEIHVWRAALDQPSPRIRDFRHVLAADELARADRFHFDKDRGHFIVARGILRAILGAYLNLAPERLRFRYGAHGKPALAGNGDDGAIRFNASHSHGVALYAIARRRDVGIDVERIRPDLAVAEIAERFFAPGEIALIRSLTAEAQRQAFFRCWTRKEAYVKARGAGLSLSLDQFDLSGAPSEPVAAIIPGEETSEADTWSLCDLAPAPGYVGAVAMAARGWRISCWQWADRFGRSPLAS